MYHYCWQISQKICQICQITVHEELINNLFDFFSDTLDVVKQSAALCLLRLFRTDPTIIPGGEWTSRIIHLLNDQVDRLFKYLICAQATHYSFLFTFRADQSFVLYQCSGWLLQTFGRKCTHCDWFHRSNVIKIKYLMLILFEPWERRCVLIGNQTCFFFSTWESWLLRHPWLMPSSRRTRMSTRAASHSLFRDYPGWA